MKYLTYLYLFLILAIGGGGYYEYDKQDKEIHRLGLVKYKLGQTKAGLIKDVADLGAQKDGLIKVLGDKTKAETDLNSNKADKQKIIDQDKLDANDANALATTAREFEDKARKHIDYLVHPPPPTNRLGTIVTVDRKTYEECDLLKVEANGITINSAQGVVKITYSFLPTDVQAKFGYDWHNPGDLTPGQVAYQEAIRTEAGD